MQILIITIFLTIFTHKSLANSSYCQDYIENGSFNSVFYPDLWSMDHEGKFKKDNAFINSEDFKTQGSIEETSEKIILSKKYIPSVPTTRVQFDLDGKGRISKIQSYQVANNATIEPLLFSSYEFRFADSKCYPYEEWDESSGTVFNTDFCREAKPLFQTYYKKKSAQKKRKKLEDGDDEKQEHNLKLSDELTELFKKFNIKDKTGKNYLETLDERAKKQSTDPDLIIIEKSLMLVKTCNEMVGVSSALNDNALSVKANVVHDKIKGS